MHSDDYCDKVYPICIDVRSGSQIHTGGVTGVTAYAYGSYLQISTQLWMSCCMHYRTDYDLSELDGWLLNKLVQMT